MRWVDGVTETDNNQKRTCERISKIDTSDKEDRGEKRLKLHGHVKRREGTC